MPSLSGQGVNYDVDAETSIVDFVEPFVSEVIIPLTAIVFITVKNANFVIELNRFEIIVNQVIAPPVEFLRRRRRTVEREEDRIEFVIVRDFFQ